MKRTVSLLEMKEMIGKQLFEQYDLNIELEKFYYTQFIKEHKQFILKLKIKYFDTAINSRVTEIFDWNLSNIGGK